MKIYAKADDETAARVARMIKAHHPDLVRCQVTVEALTVEHDDPKNEDPAISHRGYAALAQVRAVPVKDRTAGRVDAEILLDLRRYKKLPAKRKDALIDHELQHLQPVCGKDQVPRLDGAGRPRLKLRRHDRQMGWFDVIVQRHGEDAPEKVQARELVEQAGQLYFDLKNGGPGVTIMANAANN